MARTMRVAVVCRARRRRRARVVRPDARRADAVDPGDRVPSTVDPGLLGRLRDLELPGLRDARRHPRHRRGRADRRRRGAPPTRSTPSSNIEVGGNGDTPLDAIDDWIAKPGRVNPGRGGEDRSCSSRCPRSRPDRLRGTAREPGDQDGRTRCGRRPQHDQHLLQRGGPARSRWCSCALLDGVVPSQTVRTARRDRPRVAAWSFRRQRRRATPRPTPPRSRSRR